MGSEPFIDRNGQRLLRFADPPCERCYWSTDGRCSGPQTVDSQLVKQGNLLTCFDVDETRELISNLARHRPTLTDPLPTPRFLPAAIPLLNDGIPCGVRLDRTMLYGVALKDILTDKGAIRFATARDLRVAFGLPANGRLCLVASVGERKLERFWERSVVDCVWDHLRSLHFEFSTAASFSVNDHQARNGGIWNQHRNYVSVDFLADAGIPAVPILSPFVDEDIEFAARWVARHPRLRVLGALAQSLRTESEFTDLLERLKNLRSGIDRAVQFLIIGCSAVDRVDAVYREFGDATVVSKNPALKGTNGYRWDPRQECFLDATRDEVPRSDLVSDNCRLWVQSCELLRSNTTRRAREIRIDLGQPSGSDDLSRSRVLIRRT